MLTLEFDQERCLATLALEIAFPESTMNRACVLSGVETSPTSSVTFLLRHSTLPSKIQSKKLFPRYNSKTEFGKFFLVQMASGGLAGAGSLCIVYPLDYARTRLASDVGTGKRDFNGLLDCLVKTSKGPKGPLALYNGFGVSVAGIIPYRGVYFGMYDSLREKNPWKRDVGLLGWCSKFLVAQTTAITAGYASYPFDTIRRRLQMQSEKPKEQWVYKGTADCFAKILKDEGIRAMFKGAGANALRTVGSALVLVLYDQLQTMLGVNLGGGGGE